VARFRTESRLPVAVQIAENPRFRLSFNDGVELDWRPLDLVAWVAEALAQWPGGRPGKRKCNIVWRRPPQPAVRTP
jgi:hypothetical protein